MVDEDPHPIHFPKSLFWVIGCKLTGLAGQWALSIFFSYIGPRENNEKKQ
jgi:hypothetical protein